eukprot:1158532-Pelagomonas_calceolata.AAC.22
MDTSTLGHKYIAGWMIEVGFKVKSGSMNNIKGLQHRYGKDKEALHLSRAAATAHREVCSTLRTAAGCNTARPGVRIALYFFAVPFSPRAAGSYPAAPELCQILGKGGSLHSHPMDSSIPSQPSTIPSCMV